MNNVKEMRKLLEDMDEITEAPIPDDWQLQEAYRSAEQGMYMLMSRVKKLNKMANEFEGSEDTKTHWIYAIYSIQEHLEDFFKELD